VARRPPLASRWAAGALLAFAWLGGCTTWVTVPADPGAAEAARRSLPHPPTFEYQLPPPDVEQTADPAWRGRHHERVRIAFDSSGQNGQPGRQVSAEYYRSTAPGPRPVVVVLPLWGTSAYPSSAITRTLIARGGEGLSVVQVLGERYLFDWDGVATSATEAEFRARVREMSARMRTTVVDLRRLLDWIALQPELDGERIGLVGFSMSAVVGAQLIGADARVRSAVLMLGGANLEEIIATCNGPLANVRRTITERFDWSRERYEEEVGEIFGVLNPARFPALTSPDDILMIDSRFDECMPATARDAYWDALGRPRRLSLLYGHRQSFWSLTPIGFSLMRGTVYRALETSLMEAGPSGGAGEPVRASTSP
jgi:dienelactone hydrolase